MSITDELRKEARGFGRYVYTAPQADCLTAIADRIDAEHEAACAEAYGNGVMSVPIALDESAWVELPKDAHGEYIRVGDMMERGKARGHVIALMLSEYPKKWGGELHWGVQLEGEQAPTALDAFFKHYHKPTVEDVLREFAEKIIDSQIPSMHPTYEEAIAEYAAKLRLAGEDE